MRLLPRREELRIKELSKEFTDKILDRIEVKGNCFAVCYPLSIHLANNGITNSLGLGKYKDTDHYWLNLNDYKKIIVDPTIKQFEYDEDDVFIGNISSKPHDPKTDSIEQRIIDARYGWKERLFYDGYTIWELEEVPRKPPPRDFYSLLKINLTAATLVITETEQQMAIKADFIKSPEYDNYYNDIAKVIETNLPKNKDLIERLIPLLPKEFEDILHRLG